MNLLNILWALGGKGGNSKYFKTTILTLPLLLPEWHSWIFCLVQQDSASCLEEGMLVHCLMLTTQQQKVCYFHFVLPWLFFLLPYFLDAFNLAIYSQSMIGNRSFYIAVCAFSDQNWEELLSATAEMWRGRRGSWKKLGLKKRVCGFHSLWIITLPWKRSISLLWAPG